MGTAPAQGLIATGIADGAGPFLGSDGSASAPTYSFSSSGNSDNGLYLSAANVPAIAAAGAGILFVSANVVEQRNGTTAQTLRIYNTFTDASNYERADFTWAANTFTVGTYNAGTGSARVLRFAVGGSVAWQINTSEHLEPDADNAADLGGSSTRVRTGYFGTALAVGTNPASAGAIRIANNTNMFFRNAANSGDVRGIGVDASDIVYIADGATASINILNTTLTLTTTTLTFANALNLAFNATTGTKIGTAGSQKLAFYGATPIIQQTGVAVTAAGVHAALVNLGLITA